VTDILADGGHFINVFKPRHMTSSAVVSKVRRITGVKRIGHGGTLDPLANGVLPLAIGRCTRLISDLHRWPKSYVAIIMFGVTTSTSDLEGDVVATNTTSPAADDLRRGVRTFTGRIKQRPSVYSAVKINGVRAYELARQGYDFDPPEREVTVHSADLLEITNWSADDIRDIGRSDFISTTGNGGRLVAAIKYVCSTGTYVRSLAEELGQYLRCGACLVGLIRTEVGPFKISAAIPIHQLEATLSNDAWSNSGYSCDVVVRDLPGIVLGLEDERMFCNGVPVKCTKEGDRIRAYGQNGSFLGVGDNHGAGCIRPKLVFASPKG
tara:strand:+ start:210 stop:1178 length:969 start_codon:yes stop_codon:yes gene_type:complete